jgi:acetyl-CoA carboxylase biotin carboxyl carrier protein
MANEPSGSSDAFDLKSIRQLVKLMNENDLAEIDLRNGTQRVRLRKRGSELVPVVAAAPAVAAPVAPPAPAAAPSGPQQTAAAPAASNLVEIKSPMLGTFYRSPSPDAEPFVQVGSHVDNDSVVCIIEAMKVFNEITADCRGKIVAVLVENAQPVEYGQALFRVDPTG